MGKGNGTWRDCWVVGTVCYRYQGNAPTVLTEAMPAAVWARLGKFGQNRPRAGHSRRAIELIEHT